MNLLVNNLTNFEGYFQFSQKYDLILFLIQHSHLKLLDYSYIKVSANYIKLFLQIKKQMLLD